MTFRALWDTLMAPRTSRRSRRAAASGQSNRLAVESLEDRVVPAAMFTIGDASVIEGATNAVVRVHVTEPHGNAVTVDFSTANGSATAGSDYTAVSGKLTFAKNEMDKTILIPVRDDRLAESTESFIVRLANAKGAKIADSVANVSITDNEPRISITNNWSAPEGNSGVTEFNFTVTLSAAYDQNVTVDFTTMNGSASSGSDYVAKNGTLTFKPGQPLSQTITVQVNGDHVIEDDEYFTLNLSNASSNAQISNGVAYGTIYDDEPFVSVTGSTAYEGNSGTTELHFTVSLSAAYDEAVTVDFTTADGSATTADNDYLATNGTVTFLPGQPTSQDVVVLVNGDTAAEFDEYFTVNLSNPSPNARISNGVGYGTIYDDEPKFTIYDSYQDYYGSSITFYVYLSAPSEDVVTVDYATWDGSAIADVNYVATSGTLTFNPHDTMQSFTVQLLTYDPDPYLYFDVQLSNASPPVQLGNASAYGYWYYDYGYYGYYDYGYYDYGYYYW